MTTNPATPQAALSELLEGNERFIAGRPTLGDITHDHEELARGQSPFAAVLRCADSRVSPEIIFDQSLGRLFVCAVAGNLPTPEVIASLEYAVSVLGSKLILVMGHSSCGAVEAAARHREDTESLPGSIATLVEQIIASCPPGLDPDDPGELLDAVKNNADESARLLQERSPLIARAVSEGSLEVVAGVQDLATGRFRVTSPRKA